jgi:outer membrane receptor protein involved in Fe transport
MAFLRTSTFKWAVPLFAAALAIISGAIRIQAQVLYGSLVGTVTDQSGAVVPGAQVAATQIQTGQVRQDTTDQSGRYSIVNLLPGTYNVAVDAKGFKKFQQQNLTVTPNVVSRTDVHLEVGQATEEVTVSGEAAQLQTEKADTHTEITGKAVTNIPLGGYRNYQTLINLAPGAMPAKFANSITDTPGRSLQTNVNGGNAQTNITRIDGAESINVWLPNHAGLVVPAETVDVVNVTTGSADADQGLAGSSAITVVTKSGTNELHGSAFEFHNNQRLNARNFFLSPTASKPVGIYNNYGATLGGPIVKNKLFYFFSFDGTNQKTATNGTYTVPTADQRNGIFTASNTPIYDPLTGNSDGTGRTAFAGNIIPGNRISPIAQALQAYFPAPNLPGVANNYAATGGPILDRYYFDTKENWNRNEKHSIWFKYDRMWATSGGKGIFGVAGGPAPGADPGLGDTLVQVFSLGHTYLLSPSLILDGNVGYQRMVQNVKGTDFGTNYGQQLGIPGLNGSDIRTSGFPDITFNSASAFYSQFGVPNWMPLFRTDESYTTSHSLTWTKGAHQFRFGFDLVRHHLNHWQPELSNGGPRGALDFNGNLTALNGGPAANQFNSYAQFLLGYSNEVQKGLQYILMTGREWQFGWYGQDRWQITPKFTLTLGLRYELYPLMTRAAGKGIERYDPTTNNVYLGGRGNVPEDAGISVSHKLFAPRAGIAYRLGDNTVIRTGYGLNYDPIPFSRPLRGFYPLTINADFVGQNNFDAASTLAAGIPAFSGPPLESGIIPLPGNVTERSPWGFIHRGYIQSWNFTVERKLPLDLLMNVGYVGQKSTHLLADRDINTGGPGTTTAGLPYNTPAYNNRSVATSMWDGYLNSNYNSLQVAINRSFSRGLMLKGAYTYSHAIDYNDDDGWASMNWNWGPVFNRNRATAGFDRTHVFQLGWVYELPFGTNKQYLSTGFAGKVLGGWQFSGIEACYTGTPFTITAPAGTLNAPNNLQTADQVKANVQRLGNVGTSGLYYDPTAFQAVNAPANAPRFGTSGRNILRNPGTWNTDVSIVRNFPIREKVQLQFRTEFYNLPNTSHFYGPGNSTADPTTMSVTSGNYMRIIGSYGERNIRFALRLQW